MPPKSRKTKSNASGNPWLDALVNADCTDALQSNDIPPVDLIHTSPPYNIDKSYKDYTDKLHLDEYLKFISTVAELLHRRMRTGGSLFWQTGYTRTASKSDEINPLDVLTYPIFKECGFYLKDRIIWRYFGGMSFKSKFKNQHETVYWYVKGDPESARDAPYFDVDEVREMSREPDPRNNILGRNPGNVWDVDRVAYGSAEQSSHIAVFPEEVTERIVRACSKPGDFVLDPFAGSGTTPKVAKSLGRHYLGIELSKDYYREAIKRLGFQQFGEADSVVSEAIKGLLAATNGHARVADLANYVQKIVTHEPRGDEIRLLDWVHQYDHGDKIAKSAKQILWAMGDRFKSQLSKAHAENDGFLLNIASAYCRAYKLAKWFNGLRLAQIAVRVQRHIINAVATHGDWTAYLNGILQAEPSSYTIRSGGSAVSLKVPVRRIKQQSNRAAADEPQMALF